MWDYLNNKIIINGKFFSELPKEEQDAFLIVHLHLTSINSLDAAKKHHIFRTLNKTTDVNFIEMLNSYGDIPIANYIRETVCLVNQIDK